MSAANYVIASGTDMNDELFNVMRGYRTEFVLTPRNSKKIYNYPGVFANQSEDEVIKAVRYALIKYATVSDIDVDWDSIDIEIKFNPKCEH